LTPPIRLICYLICRAVPQYFSYNLKVTVFYFTSLLFIKARFYTHLPATSNLKTFAWETSVLGTNCSGTSAIANPGLANVSLVLSFTTILAARNHHKVPLPFPKGCGPFPYMLEEYAKEPGTHEMGGPDSAFLITLSLPH
jgi:hypothetical protein